MMPASDGGHVRSRWWGWWARAHRPMVDTCALGGGVGGHVRIDRWWTRALSAVEFVCVREREYGFRLCESGAAVA